MAHEFGGRMKRALEEETSEVNPDLVNYIRLLRKVGKLQYQAKINRILIFAAYGLAIILLIVTEIDHHIHL
jgi:hypothetical protein